MEVLKSILGPIDSDYLHQNGSKVEGTSGSGDVLAGKNDQGQKSDIKPGEDEELHNLMKFMEINQHDVILEKIRSTSDYPLNFSDDEVSFLIDKFTQHNEEIIMHQNKLIPINEILSNLNQELNKLSESLITLHDKSNNLTNHLSNNSVTTDKLNPIILDLIIPPDIVNSIINGPVNVAWLENLRFINEKQQLIESINSGKLDANLIALYKDSVAFKQLCQGIDDLIIKAIESIRDHLINQIKLLRSSNTKSSQSIQQDLLRIKEIWPFLHHHKPKLSNQLKLAYFFTMRWYYTSKFAKYLYALQKLHLRHVDVSMILSHTEEKSYFALKNWIPSTVGGAPSSPNLNQPNSNIAPGSNINKLTFNEYLGSIDKRLEILADENNRSIPAQIAETTPFGYWIEFIFNQWFQALIDNVMVEYFFVIDFFYQSDEKLHLVEIPKNISNHEHHPINNDSDSNNNSENNKNNGSSSGNKKNSQQDELIKKDWSLIVFEEVYKIGKDFVTWLITHQPSFFNNRSVSSSYSRIPTATSSSFGTCDAYGILLMIRIIQNSQNKLHTQFHIPVLEDHLNSLYFELWPHFSKIIDLNSDSLKKTIIRISSNKNLAPTVVTQQYGQYLSGLLKLCNKEGINGEPIFNSLVRLRNDFENTITKITNQFKNQSDKEIFLFNNYFLIVNILKNENKQDNEFIQEQIKHFDMLCDAYRK